MIKQTTVTEEIQEEFEAAYTKYCVEALNAIEAPRDDPRSGRLSDDCGTKRSVRELPPEGQLKVGLNSLAFLLENCDWNTCNNDVAIGLQKGKLYITSNSPNR